MAKQVLKPGCCESGDSSISWEVPPARWQDCEGPAKEGWAVPFTDHCLVNVDYCPFCGKKLPEVGDRGPATLT